jgi:hypothetical protein
LQEYLQTTAASLHRSVTNLTAELVMHHGRQIESRTDAVIQGMARLSAGVPAQSTPVQTYPPSEALQQQQAAIGDTAAAVAAAADIEIAECHAKILQEYQAIGLQQQVAQRFAVPNFLQVGCSLQSVGISAGLMSKFAPKISEDIVAALKSDT